MSDRGVKKGDRFVAGGTAKIFKVDAIKDGFVTLEEDKKATAEANPSAADPEPEVVTTSIDNLFDQDDWVNAQD